jgi:hypothetical protein
VRALVLTGSLAQGRGDELSEGPQKLDLAFEEGLAPDPWLLEGYRVLAGELDEEPQLDPPPPGPEGSLRGLHAHAWDGGSGCT